ncbi:calcium-binding protein [Pseudooceanicola atlanticus]|uniref:calcium-binding protein n=1 Tax=Pseudooceanicola atlanticus TaxID=1461694 RepID=UPI0009DE6084|nr:calcium-binding protein [Pseudooceanicola atlanticus]
MVWNATIFGSTAEMHSGLEGYFKFGALTVNARLPVVQVLNSSPTVPLNPGDVAIGDEVAPGAGLYNLARMVFSGTGLTVGQVPIGGNASITALTGGTITGIRYYYNDLLSAAQTQGLPYEPAMSLETNLRLSAVITLPNVPATQFTNALVQTYLQDNPAIFRAFLSSFQHVYIGTDNVNLMAGYDGNDLLDGRGGDDFLQGDGGNDTLIGGEGTDGLHGGPGNDLYLPGPPSPNTPIGDTVTDTGTDPNEIDTISYANATGPVTVDLNQLDGDQGAGWAFRLRASGIERVIGSIFSDVLIGTDFPESIQDSPSDILEGNLGDDTLYGLSGSDFLQGGPGFDVLIGGPDGEIRGPGPGDVAIFNVPFAQLDLFRPGDGSVLVAAPGGGVDRLFEVEYIQSTNGFHLIQNIANSTKGLFVGDGAANTLNGGVNDDLIFGRSGNDTLNGNAGNDVIEGENGSDTIDGGPGADMMYGGNDGDTYFVDNIGDSIVEFADGGGIDHVFSSVDYAIGTAHIENVTLTGDALDVFGNDLDNLLVGNFQNNFMDGGLGSDTMRGGAGHDIYFIRTPGDTVEEDANSGTDTVRTLLSHTLQANFENLELLGNENGRATGNNLNNRLEGNGARNFLEGMNGDDTLFGSNGNDTLDGGVGADLMNGGPGSDNFYVDNAGDRVAESRSWGGTDTVFASVDFRMGRSHIEDLRLTGNAVLGAGNGLQNEIRGNNGDNVLDGGKNNDTMMGGNGNDTYLVRAPGDEVIEAAGRGIDAVKAFRAYILADNVENLFLQTLRNDAGQGVTGINGIGNELDNTVVGNPFDNVIIGREGRDTLKGQGGADTFVFDRALGSSNVDRIIDFNVNTPNEGDMLKMKGAVFGGLTAGSLSSAHFRAGTVAQDGNDRFIFDQGTGRLWFDADGSGAGTQQLVATFEQNAVVTATDFEIF